MPFWLTALTPPSVVFSPTLRGEKDERGWKAEFCSVCSRSELPWCWTGQHQEMELRFQKRWLSLLNITGDVVLPHLLRWLQRGIWRLPGEVKSMKGEKPREGPTTPKQDPRVLAIPPLLGQLVNYQISPLRDRKGIRRNQRDMTLGIEGEKAIARTSTSRKSA